MPNSEQHNPNNVTAAENTAETDSRRDTVIAGLHSANRAFSIAYPGVAQQLVAEGDRFARGAFPNISAYYDTLNESRALTPGDMAASNLLASRSPESAGTITSNFSVNGRAVPLERAQQTEAAQMAALQAQAYTGLDEARAPAPIIPEQPVHKAWNQEPSNA